MLETAEYRRNELFQQETFHRLASILGLTENELQNSNFNIAENRDEKGRAYSIVLFFDPNLPISIQNKIIGMQKENVVVIPIEQLGLK